MLRGAGIAGYRDRLLPVILPELPLDLRRGNSALQTGRVLCGDVTSYQRPDVGEPFFIYFNSAFRDDRSLISVLAGCIPAP